MLYPIGLSEDTGPVGLGEVTAEISSIGQLLDGGFASVLAAMAATAEVSAAPASPGPSAAGGSGYLPTAVVTTGPANEAGALGSPAASPEPGSSLGSQAVALAEGFVGTPYAWGGESPRGFDCSGLVQYVYRQLGVELPRTSEQQAGVGERVPSLAEAEPGDLVFFPGSDGTAEHPGHVGIYIGNGEMVDAPYTGTVVQVQPVGRPSEIRRVAPEAATSPPEAASGGGSGQVVGPGALPYNPPGAGPATPSTATGGAYAGVFARAAASYGLPEGLLEAMATAESGMDPEAVSPAGAEGMMQLMPQVASSLGVDPFDPSQAIPAAASLVSRYLREFGSLQLALAAYNAGPGAVLAYGGVPPYPETQSYVSKVTGLMGEPT